MPTAAHSLIRPWFFILPFAGNWNYDDPNIWRLNYPQCGGNHQSPIALFTTEAFPDDSFQLNFVNYNKTLKAPVDMLNNGYTVEVGMRTNEDASIPHITVGNFIEKFEIQAIHFHWGSTGRAGAEHVINGNRYDMEMHMIHKNSKYTTIEEARNHRDGILVLAVLFKAELTPKNDPPPAVDEVLGTVESILEYNTTAEVEGPLTMDAFISNLDTKNYFAYRGSVTTPPCSEAALWFVFLNPLEIPYEGLIELWNLKDSRGLPLVNNFRPLQPTNRPVFLFGTASNLVK